MITTQKAVPCVLKDLGSTPRLLTFKHPPPTNDFQIPKGTVEPGEAIEEALLRELYEESGIDQARIVCKVQTFGLVFPAGTYSFTETEQQFWHIYHLEVDRSLPENWLHTVTGEGGDAGLQFDYFWQPLFNDPFDNFLTHYVLVMNLIRKYLKVQRPILAE